MAVDAILSRLSKLRETGRGRWLSCCPHHIDRTPSLSVRELEDGRVLLHCFAGCSAAEIVESIGLEVGDLFPPRMGDFKPVRQPFAAVDVLRALSLECRVVAVAVCDIADGKALNDRDANRVTIAADRITDGLRYADAL